MALNSTSTIKIIDLLCEGPIQGLVGQRDGIFLDESPLSTDGTAQIPEADASFDFRVGGRTQKDLNQATNFTSTITDVNQEVGENYSETLDANNEVTARDYGAGQQIRTITDSTVDSFQCIFTIPRLFSTAKEGLANGQLFNGNLRIVVYVQAQGGAYNSVYDKTVTGVSVSNYQIKTPRIELSGSGPWNIKVEKVNLYEDHFEVKYVNFEQIPLATSLANSRANRLVWTSLVEMKSLRSAYPYSAVAGLSLSTRQFGSLPTRAYKIRGRIVKTPNNAVPRADGSLDFSPTFDGGLTENYTTCPVCCWYDMLTNPRYGAGDFVDASNVSWVDLYPLAQYANQLVTNPDGTTEPRFACNVVIGDQAEAFNVLQDLASVFRGMLYWQANTIQATADHGNLDGTPVASVHLYTNSNVIEGLFNYSGTSLKTRSTSIRVRYNDPENFYKSNLVVVEDAALIAKYGYQVKEIIGFGVTSKYQAQRLGRWMLAAEEIDGEVVSFTTGLQGAVVFPGQVFAVQDEVRAGARLGGRVSSATTSAITGDQTITLPAGDDHRLTCTLPDGSVETRDITSVSGAVINTEAFSAAPLAQSIYSIQSNTVLEQKFRCLSVADGGEGTYAITGVEHNDSIYNTADSGATLTFRDVTTFNQPVAAPTNITFTPSQINIGATSINRVTASWTQGDNATTGYQVRYKLGGGNFFTTETQAALFEIDGFSSGTRITLQVRTVRDTPFVRYSPWVSGEFLIPIAGVDPDDPNALLLPPPPQNVTVQATNDQVVLRWEIPSGTQRANELLAIIRHATQTDGTGEWANSVLLAEHDAQTNTAVLPLLEGEYLVKFQNKEGQRSPAARSAIVDLPDALPRLNIDVRREDLDSPPFQGDRDGVVYSDEYDGLVLDGDQTIDDLTVNIDDPSVTNFDFFGTRLLQGSYFFRNVLDLGGVFSVVFTRTLTNRGLYPDDAIDARAESVDRWSDFDGDLPDDNSAGLFFRTSDQATVDEDFLTEDADKLLLETGDNIEMESDINFGPWIPMESGRYTGRQFQFKCDLTSGHIDQTPLIDQLGYKMQLESRTESGATQASGAGAKAVTFTDAFYEAPSVGITASNLLTGDYYEVTSASRTGFTVTFYDSSSTAVDRNFSYQATGYGTETT